MTALAIMVTIVLAAVFGLGVAVAVLANRLAGTPDKYLILSTGAIGTAVYALTVILFFEVIPPLRWTNGEPSDLRTAFWEHPLVLALVPAVFFVALWQAAMRRRRGKARVA